MYMPLLIFLTVIGLFILFLTNNFFIRIMTFCPGFIVLTMPICLFNVSLAYDLALNFEVLFCELNVFVYVLLDFSMVINGLNLTTGSGVFYFFMYSMPSFILTSSIFYFDCIPREILSIRIKKILFGVFSIVALINNYGLAFIPKEGNFTIQIYDDYGINIQEKCGSAYLCVSIFLVKNFIYTIVCPNDFVMYTMPLRRKI